MRKLIFLFLAAGSLIFVQSCGNNNSENNQQSEKDSVMNKSENTEVKETKSVKEFANIPELLKKSDFTAEEFCNVTNFLFQKEAVLLVYPYAYPGNKEVKIHGRNIQMLNKKDNSGKKVSINVKLKIELPEQTVKAGKLLAIKGKLDMGYRVDDKWGNKLTMSIYDAEIIKSEDEGYEGFNSIADLDLSKPVFSGDLANALTSVYETLAAKDLISVTGVYYATTTSKDGNGNILATRVDLGEKAVNPIYKVGCSFDGKVDSDALDAKRTAGEKLTIEGKFGGSAWTPKLSHCKIKN